MLKAVIIRNILSEVSEAEYTADVLAYFKMKYPKFYEVSSRTLRGYGLEINVQKVGRDSLVITADIDEAMYCPLAKVDDIKNVAKFFLENEENMFRPWIEKPIITNQSLPF